MYYIIYMKLHFLFYSMCTPKNVFKILFSRLIFNYENKENNCMIRVHDNTNVSLRLFFFFIKF